MLVLYSLRGRAKVDGKGKEGGSAEKREEKQGEQTWDNGVFDSECAGTWVVRSR